MSAGSGADDELHRAAEGHQALTTEQRHQLVGIIAVLLEEDGDRQVSCMHSNTCEFFDKACSQACMPVCTYHCMGVGLLGNTHVGLHLYVLISFCKVKVYCACCRAAPSSLVLTEVPCIRCRRALRGMP